MGLVFFEMLVVVLLLFSSLGSQCRDCLFWSCRPRAPLIEKRAIKNTNAKIGQNTNGVDIQPRILFAAERGCVSKGLMDFALSANRTGAAINRAHESDSRQRSTARRTLMPSCPISATPCAPRSTKGRPTAAPNSGAE